MWRLGKQVSVEGFHSKSNIWRRRRGNAGLKRACRFLEHAPHLCTTKLASYNTLEKNTQNQHLQIAVCFSTCEK